VTVLFFFYFYFFFYFFFLSAYFLASFSSIARLPPRSLCLLGSAGIIIPLQPLWWRGPTAEHDGANAR